jgi:hypothetical protein
VVVSASPARTRVILLDTLAPALNSYGYELVSHSEGGLLFERSRRPTWTIFVAVFAFPLGLLALTVRTTERIAMSVEAQGTGRTALTVHGVAPRSIRKVFSRMSFS